MRLCKKCNKEKDAHDFRGKYGHCKSCDSDWHRANYIRNKARIDARNKAWQKANKERYDTAIDNASMIKRYGFSRSQYDALLSKQLGVCAICGSATVRRKNGKRLIIDHMHDTGAVRGLLCHPCNIGLGSFSDNPETLQKAINYLKSRGYYST